MKSKQETIYKNFKLLGNALGLINANNTHSGNISQTDPDNDDYFYITSSGSQIGSLVPRDIVPVKFSDVSWGDGRGSTESTIHRKLLGIPGINAVAHGHFMNCTTISFDHKEKEIFLEYIGLDKKGREEFRFSPIDLFGAYVVGSVQVGSYEQPVGSPEMEERLPVYLKENHLTIVRGHGPFARGSSLEDCLYRLGVLEHSATLALHLRRRGYSIVNIQRKIQKEGKDIFFPVKPHFLDESMLEQREVTDKVMIQDFEERLNYNYKNLIGAYGTGSMSQKVSANEMIYCPMSAVPDGMNFPMLRLNLDFQDDDSVDMCMHKLIYKNTIQNACMITTNPMAVADGMAILAEKYGAGVLAGEKLDISYEPDNHPVVAPIDAEAIYLNPRLGLVDIHQLNDMSPENPILNMLRNYKGCCVVAGYGVISTGETTLEQAAHNASSAERIAQFRSDVYINEKMMNGPKMKSFEPLTK